MHITRTIVAVVTASLIASSVPNVAIAGPGVAGPESPPSPREQEEAKVLRAEAEEHFFRDEYDDAVQKFERAFGVAGHPSDLFNAGRVYEEKGDIVTALERYEQFAEQPRVALEDRAIAAKRIEVLRVLVDEGGDGGGDENRSAPPPAMPAGSTPADAPTPADTGKPMIIAGGALLGIGSAIAIAGGIGFGLAARRNSDKVDDLANGTNPDRVTLAEAEDLEAQGKDFAALQISFLVAGGAIAVVGAGLLAGGIVRRKNARLRALGPSVGPRTVGINAIWRF